jgi:outer membrane usher protein
MEIYVNGILTRRITLAPGPFDVRNLPLTAGSGNTQVVIRDAFGRTEAMVNTPYYLSPGTLARGVSDYGISAGFIRENPATTSFSFGSPALLGYGRFGLTDKLTLGGRMEASTAGVSAGPSLSTDLLFGSIDASAAASLTRDGPGTAAALGYSYSALWMSAGWSLQYMSPLYANTSLDPTQDRSVLSGTVFAAVPIRGVVTIGADARVLNGRDHGLSTTVDFNTQARLHPTVTLMLTASRQTQPDQPTLYSGTVQLIWTPGASITASVDYQGSNTSQIAEADVNRSLPVGVGYGYRVHVSGGQGQPVDITGAAQYQSPYGYYEVDASHQGSTTSGSVLASGSIVYIGNHFFFARAVQRGYALVQVPDVSGVRVSVNNQEIGRTDAHGNLLVPDLAPYYANRISINDSDVPLTYTIQSRAMTVATPFKGGALLRFDINRAVRVQGSIVVTTSGAQRKAPAFGELSVDVEGRTLTSPLGSGGEFYLEDLKVGTWSAEISYGEKTCRAQLRIKDSNDPVQDLGEIPCQ